MIIIYYYYYHHHHYYYYYAKSMQNPTSLKPITRRQILDSSKLKEFADDKFKFDKNWQKVIQTGRKHCGKRLVSQGRQKVSLGGNGLSYKD